MKSEKNLIVGTGALATLFGARLCAAGVDVILLGTWVEALEAINQRGLQLEGKTACRVRGTADPADCAPARLALVLVKSWQTERAAHQLAACLAPDGLAVSLQNGLGNEAVLARVLSPARMISPGGDIRQGREDAKVRTRIAMGVTTLGATLTAPGIVRMAGEGPLWLERHPGVSPLVTMLQKAGFTIEVVDDIRPHVWGKLVINAAINPLTAILRVKNGMLISDPLARTLMGRLAWEAAAVAEAHGVDLPFPSPIYAAEEVAQRTEDNLSSMLRDVLRGARTEVDGINGEIVRRGEACGVAVPVNRLVWELVGKQSRLSSAKLSDMVR